MSMGRVFFEAAARYGGRPAMISGDDTVSYAGMIAQATHVAAHLRALGIGAGDRVGIAVQNPIETVLAILACWRLDATAAIIDFRVPAAQRARLVRDFVFAAVLESRALAADPDYPSVLFRRDWRFAAAGAEPEAPITCAHPAFIAFTSGTTGDPKAYTQPHDILVSRHRDLARPADRAAPRYMTPLSLSFISVRSYTLSVLLEGGLVQFASPVFTPSELIEDLLAFGATATSLPPATIAQMVRLVGERPTALLPAITDLRSTGGPAQAETKLAAYRNLSPGYRFSYASTLTGRVTMLAGQDVLARPETAGRLIEGVRVDIIDAEGNPLPPGAPGTIKVWSGTVAPLALLPGNRLGVDPQTMGPGWGIAGDVGFLDGEGFLTIVDRLEDMIVRGGVSVAPQELEKILRGHPGVAEVAVVGFPHEVLGQEIAAFIVAEGDLAPAGMRAYITANIAPEKRPREIRFVASLPYSDNGKILRRKLVELVAS